MMDFSDTPSPRILAQQRRRDRDRIWRQNKRAHLDADAAAAIRHANTVGHRRHRAALAQDKAAQIREVDKVAHRAKRSLAASAFGGPTWWHCLPHPRDVKPLRLTWSRQCSYCGIAVITGEQTHDRCFVCGPAGKNLMPALPKYPKEWDVFIRSPKIGSLSREINNLFSLTALGVDNGEFENFGSGVSAVTLNGGRTYHRIIPAEEGEHAIRWFLYDPNSLHKHASERKVKPEWIAAVLAGLQRVNPFIRELEVLALQGPLEEDLSLQIEFPDSVASSEIAAVVSVAPAGLPVPRRYVIRYKGETEHKFLKNTSPLIEPLHYLLLLPYGTYGWTIGQQSLSGHPISQMRWYRTRYFMNAPQMSVFSRLAGEWLVDAWSAVEESRLSYIRANQHGTADDEDDDGLGDDDANASANIRLPSSFIHSPAWSKAHVADCLALRRKMGNITFFLTFTCNPKWPEIISQLLPGQTAQDRPDVTIRAFKARLSAVFKYLRLLFGPERYHISVVEFQKRGLPHLHLAIALRYVPYSPDELDCILSAEIPTEPGALQDAVKAHMLHDHSSSRKYSRCGYPEKRCHYGFPKPLKPSSSFSENGTFEPRRRNEGDEWVVLYCPQLLLAWDGHVNVEYGASSALPVYLYKYFFKGPDETRFSISKEQPPSATSSTSIAPSGSSSQTIDEVKNYERARWLSAMEAAWRLAGFHISEKYPGVTRLPIHLPNQQYGQMRRKDGQKADATFLMRYLDRPRHPQLDNLTYIQFGESCRFVAHDSTPVNELEIVENLISGRTQRRIRFYEDSSIRVARMLMVYPRHGEVFYLRCILAHRPAHSFIDARTIDGIVYSTFQEAARAMGLLDNQNEGELAFRELVEQGVSPSQLRWLFCVLASEGHPALSLWEEYEDALALDIVERQKRLSCATLDARNELLILLQDMLSGMGKKLADIGLPQPTARRREVDSERAMWGGDPDDLHSFSDSLTNDQRTIYERVRALCNSPDPNPVHIDGRAGRGKTYCVYPLIGALRKEQKIVLITAASAYAAKNYPGGRTHHYLYGIPVDENCPFLESAIRPNSDRAALLLEAACHIVDEVGSLHFKAFDCADRLMRSLTKVNRVWGGRMLITLGDFRQTAPVVRRGGRKEICGASLRTQPIFKQFELLRLHEPMRQAADPQFSSWLDTIGDDYEHEDVDLGRLAHTDSINEVLDFVFPLHVTADPAACVKRAILSPLNDFVDELNDRVLDRIPGDDRIYFSTDCVEDDDNLIGGADNPLASPDFLNGLNETGIPPHRLRLKVGSIVRFVRNFSGPQGVTKNTRAIVTRLNKYTVEVSTLPTVVGKRTLPSIHIPVPRIDFQFSPPKGNFVVHRKQFPIVLSYAVTFNSCQGLTVQRLALDLRRPVFSHGQLYCAVTRVPAAADVLILKSLGDDSTLTRNVVWKELLLDV